jgi:hypothetical protein
VTLCVVVVCFAFMKKQSSTNVLAGFFLHEEFGETHVLKFDFGALHLRDMDLAQCRGFFMVLMCLLCSE